MDIKINEKAFEEYVGHLQEDADNRRRREEAKRKKAKLEEEIRRLEEGELEKEEAKKASLLKAANLIRESKTIRSISATRAFFSMLNLFFKDPWEYNSIGNTAMVAEVFKEVAEYDPTFNTLTIEGDELQRRIAELREEREERLSDVQEAAKERLLAQKSEQDEPKTQEIPAESSNSSDRASSMPEDENDGTDDFRDDSEDVPSEEKGGEESFEEEEEEGPIEEEEGRMPEERDPRRRPVYPLKNRFHPSGGWK